MMQWVHLLKNVCGEDFLKNLGLTAHHLNGRLRKMELQSLVREPSWLVQGQAVEENSPAGACDGYSLSGWGRQREPGVVLNALISLQSSIQTCNWLSPPYSWWTSGVVELLHIFRCLRQRRHWKQMQRRSLQNSLIWLHTESLSHGAEISWAFTLDLNNGEGIMCY